MAKTIDLSGSDGDLVIIGRSLVIPNSDEDSQPTPLNGALRFNPTLGIPEVFSNGSWFSLSLGGSGSGSVPSSTVTMANVIGLNSTLSGKAPLIHSHSISDITDLTGILATKAGVIHGHDISDITGLQTALDGKAASGHFHTFVEHEKISTCLPGNPPALLRVVWVATDKITLPANLVGSQIKAMTAPAASFVITLYRNTTIAVGTITIATTGAVTKATSSVVLNPGDTLTFALPARDTALNTVVISLLGSRDPQNIA